MKEMDKTSIVNAVIKKLTRQKTGLETGLVSAKRAALESPGAMQSHSDTTKSQMHTLAANIEKLIKEKTAAINALKTSAISEPGNHNQIKLGTLVEIEGQNEQKIFYLIVPEGGAGAVVKVDGVTVISLTTKSPLGSALFNRKIGETVILENKNGKKILNISNIF